MSDVAAHCRRAGGVITTAALKALGVGDRAVRAAVEHGAVERLRRGTFGEIALPPDARAALRHGGPLCCASALRSYDVWVLDDPDTVHVWLGGDARAHPHDACRCRAHRDRAPAVAGWRVPLVQALVQLLGCRGDEAFFAALESALRHDRLRRSEVADLRGRIPQRHRWLVDLARTDADSGLESLVRLRLHRLGIRMQSQVRVPGVGIVDFVVGDCLILEADGATHGGDHRHRDLVRDAVAAALGFVTLRFDYAMILFEWDLVEDAILAALRSGRHLAGRRGAPMPVG